MKSRAESLGYYVTSSYKSSGAYLNIHVSEIAANRNEAVKLVERMGLDFFEFISVNQELTAISWLDNQLKFLPRDQGSFQTLYDYLKDKEQRITIMLTCNLNNRSYPKCWIEVASAPVL